MYIACPKCDWRPSPETLWTCTCGHQWNSFETHGICPACSKVWTVTQCSGPEGCGEYSDHEDWYHAEDDFTVAEYLENPRIAMTVPQLPAAPASTPSLPKGPVSDLLESLLKQMLTLYETMDDEDQADLQRMRSQLGSPSSTEGHVTLIVPIGVVHPVVVQAALEALETTFVHPVEVMMPIDLPSSAFNVRRGQYRAARLLDMLSYFVTPDVFRVVGLVDEDIYQAGTNFVFGTQWPGSKLIILGTRRFFTRSSVPGEAMEDVLRRRVGATLISQIGASLGLKMCSSPGCARNPSNSLIDTDQKTARLCPDCAAQIAAWLKPWI